MKTLFVLIVLLIGSCALAQESRAQFSVRVAAEESAAQPQVAKQAKPPRQPAKKQVAQSWPKPSSPRPKKKSNSSPDRWGKTGS